jgi:hypothetical protein
LNACFHNLLRPYHTIGSGTAKVDAAGNARIMRCL